MNNNAVQNELNQMSVLEVIRDQGDKIEFPLTKAWEELEQILSALEEIGFIDKSEDCYSVTRLGRQVLHLFNMERHESQEPLESYADVVIDGKSMDARIPVASYILKKNGMEDAKLILETNAIGAVWSETVTMVTEAKKNSDGWSRLISSNMIFEAIRKSVSVDAWKILGKTEEEAMQTAQWLLNPWDGQAPN